MKKTLTILLICIMMLTMLTACVTDTSKPSAQEPTKAAEAPTTAPADDAEIVNGKFVKTRKITVEIYDRGNDGGSRRRTTSTDFIKEGCFAITMSRLLCSCSALDRNRCAEQPSCCR